MDDAFQFDAAKGARILSSRFFGIQIDSGAPTLWWCDDCREWVEHGRSNTAICRSFKAFKRHIRKHKDVLAGCRIRLISRFVGHDVHYSQEPRHDV